MDPEDKIEDQGGENQDVQEENNGDGNGEGEQSKDQNQGGEGDATPKIKIGEKEYTPEELTEIIAKGNNYDNLLPEYTKATQALAKFNKSKDDGEHKEDDNLPPWTKPGWKPKTFEEVAQAIIWARDQGKTEALKTLEEREAQAKQVKAEVDNFMADVKKSNPDFDESDFSDYVIKHTEGKEDLSVADLKMLYSAYKDLDAAAKLGEEKARGNQGNRNERVNTHGNDGGGEGSDLGKFRGTGNIRDIAANALRSIKGEQ